MNTKKMSERPSSGKNDPPMLKMKELMAATGVSKATILHYVKEGLLSEPVRTSRNMAYYVYQSIERITFIKQLQFRHRLGLSEIRTILKERDKGHEVTPLIEMKEVVFGRSDSEDLDTAAFCQTTELSTEEVEDFLTQGLLIPKKEGVFDSEDVVIGKVLHQGTDIGIRPKDIKYYRHFAEKIVDEDMALRKRLIKDQSYEDAITLTLNITRIARSFRAYVIDRVFQERALSQALSNTEVKKFKKKGKQNDSNKNY